MAILTNKKTMVKKYLDNFNILNPAHKFFKVFFSSSFNRSYNFSLTEKSTINPSTKGPNQGRTYE